MDTLQTYLGIIENSNCDQFAVALDRINSQTVIQPGQRLGTIVPLIDVTLYEISLDPDELLLLKLSCPGEYRHYVYDNNRKIIMKYYRTMERLRCR